MLDNRLYWYYIDDDIDVDNLAILQIDNHMIRYGLFECAPLSATNRTMTLNLPKGKEIKTTPLISMQVRKQIKEAKTVIGQRENGQ